MILRVAENLAQLFRPEDTRNKAILSVGPGTGSLTKALAFDSLRKPSRIVMVEREGRCLPLLTTLKSEFHKHQIESTLHQCDHMSESFLSSLFSPDWLGDTNGKAITNWSTPWSNPANVCLIVTFAPKFSDLNLTHLLRWMSIRSGIHAFGRVPMYIFCPRILTAVCSIFYLDVYCFE